MSPSKKKAAKKTAKKPSAKAKAPKSKKKAAPKKQAKPAKTKAKKSAAKKTAKPAAKKAPVKTTAKKAAKAPAKKKAAAKAKTTTKSAAKKATKQATKPPAKAAKAATKSAKGKVRGKETKASKRARAKKPVAPTGPRHPKLGYKWACFDCGAKFYDLGKEHPICPKCGADQNEKPPVDANPSVRTPKPKVVRPMAQLLDDEEPTPSPEDEARTRNPVQTEKEMFDDAESDSADQDLDDAEGSNAAVEPPEIDAV